MVRPPPALSALSPPAISLWPSPRFLVFRVFSYSPLSLIHRFFLFRTFSSSPLFSIPRFFLFTAFFYWSAKSAQKSYPNR
jgi:hypothetical protein